MAKRPKKKLSELKIFLRTNNINQTELSEASGLGITTLHYFLTDGKGTETTAATIAETLQNTFGLKITAAEVYKMGKK